MNRRAFLAAATGCAIAKVEPVVKAGDVLTVDLVGSPLPMIFSLAYAGNLMPGMKLEVFDWAGKAKSQWVIQEGANGSGSIKFVPAANS